MRLRPHAAGFIKERLTGTPGAPDITEGDTIVQFSA